ncbi:MAG: hypothetical protein PHX18_05825 [Candidatus Gastranaerophilales bacterium]|nr:hypothetical protein [Candidatus Gastranaerophilales bacterium]
MSAVSAVAPPISSQVGTLTNVGGKVFTFLDGTWAKAYGLELYNARKAGALKDFHWIDTYKNITAEKMAVQHPGFFATIKGGLKKLVGKKSGLGGTKIITGTQVEVRAAAKSAMKTAYKEAMQNVAEGTTREAAKQQAMRAARVAGKAAAKTAQAAAKTAQAAAKTGQAAAKTGQAVAKTGQAAAKTGFFSKLFGTIGKKLGPILIAGVTLFSMYQGYKEGGVVEALKEGIKGIASVAFFSLSIALATAVLGPVALPFAFLIGIGGCMIGDKIMSCILGKSIATQKAELAEKQEKEVKKQASANGANNLNTNNIYAALAQIDPVLAAKMARDNNYYNNPYMPGNINGNALYA